MSPLTDAFDIALQVREEVVDRIFHAMHRGGSIRHHFVRVHANKHVELQIASPAIYFVTIAQPDHRARALSTSRVHYHSRDLANSRDVGTGAVADVNIRSILELTSGDPGSLGPETGFVVDWQETTRDDITVHGVAAALRNEVKDALLDFIHDHGSRSYPIPQLGRAGASIGNLAFRFLPAISSAGRVLVIGMNVGNIVKGEKAGLRQVFVQQEWALALSEAYVLTEIRDRLQQHFGQLPPPHGAAPITLSDKRVCAFDTPFGCVDHARQRVILDSFEVSLLPGRIVFSGQVRQTIDAWYVPDVSATFSVATTLSIAPDQSLTVTVQQPIVELQEWYADVVNFFSFGALEDVVRDGVRAALQSNIAQGQFSDFFSSQMLERLASLGSRTTIQINPTATSVEIRRDAVIFHGRVAVPNVSAEPEADLAILPAGSPTQRLLHGGRSWAPGGQITQYTWDFGDGQSETSAGTNARFVTQHRYAPGIYTARLTVMDHLGRTDSSDDWNLRIQVLTLLHTSRGRFGEWKLCYNREEPEKPFEVEIAVLHDGTPVDDVLVTIRNNYGWEESRYTAPDGKVQFHLAPEVFRVQPGGVWGRPALQVIATRSGYYSSWDYYFQIVDCAELEAVIDKAALFPGLLNELLGIPVGGPHPGNGDLIGPIDPAIANRVADLKLSLDTIINLARLTERGSNVLPVENIFSIAPEEGDRLKIISQHFDEMYASVLKSAEALRKELEASHILEWKGKNINSV